MPPKRRATRSAKATEVAQVDTSAVDPDVPEPQLKKQAKGRGRKRNIKKAEEPLNGDYSTVQKSPEAQQIEEREKETQPTKSPEDKPAKQTILKKKEPTIIAPPGSSPSKRVSSISSRIPSPVRKPLFSSSHQPLCKSDLDSKKTETAITQAFTTKNLAKLSSIIEDLKSTKSEQNFDNYKASVEVRFKTSDDLITSLTAKNEALQAELESLKENLAVLHEGQGSSSAGAVAAASDESQYQNELILDMMEQIVGLRIHRAEETDEALSFDCSQSGKNGILDYKLTISKENIEDLIYTPINSENEIEELKGFLPDYFFDDLTFPLDTLQQFYHKIYRGLNK